MKRLAIIVLSLVATLVQPALASREDDAKYIASQIISDEFRTSVHDHYVRQSAKFISRDLAAKSIKVIDIDTFSNALKPHISGPSPARLEQILVDSLLGQIKPGKMEEIANYVRTNPIRAKPNHAATLDVAKTENVPIEKTLEAIDSAIEDGSLTVGFGLSLVLFSTMISATTDPQNFFYDPEAPFMADVLATDGLFRFPNRIMRQNYIQEIRKANQ
jgi:hypothetical protein